MNERETLLKEIHHRVKNNLQIISSLLNLQAGSLEDEAAIDAVKEGQNRVKSMALIHENLYQNDDLSGIEVDEYIENLTRTLYGSFGVDEEKIKTNLSVEKIRLDIDTLIPLGLMLNELLCNALKYAFPEGQGNLALSLRQSENKLDLKVKDDGPGISKEKLENGNSYGWKMIKSLSRKLKADISIENDRGTQISLSIRNYQLVT
ncbi:MAG: sensor histidine kinase [Bacteroidota bacterium]